MKNIAVLLLSLLFIGGFAVSGQAASDKKPVCEFPGFNSLKSSKQIPQWQRVTEVMKAEPLTDDFALSPGMTLKALREKTATMTLVEKLGFVNTAWLELPYHEDSKNWGIEDYWATPYEMARKSGDEEDFCIAKYYTLKYLGFAPEQMWIVVGKDGLGERSAILVVKMDGEQYILSDQFNRVLSSKERFLFQPEFALNELDHVRFVQTPARQQKAE